MAQINSSWLRSFTVLCEERNFTRAAQRLNMTQPGMSQHVAKLEEQLGARLVERDAPGFLLTEAGQKTWEMASERWRREREFRDSLNDGDPNSGTVGLACSGSFAMLLFPALLSWMATAPGISLHLTAAPNADIVSGVLSGSFDLGVVSDAPRHHQLNTQRLTTERLDLILPRDWCGRLPTFDQLQALGYVQHPDGSAYADKVLSANYADDYSGADNLRVRVFVNQISQIPLPVAHGLGYTILPRSGVLAFPNRNQITIADLPRASPHELSLIDLKGRRRSARVQRLIEIVGKEAGRLA